MCGLPECGFFALHACISGSHGCQKRAADSHELELVMDVSAGNCTLQEQPVLLSLGPSLHSYFKFKAILVQTVNISYSFIISSETAVFYCG